MRKQNFSLQPAPLGKISHDLKTPISSIKAFIQILQRRTIAHKYEEIPLLLQKIDSQTDKLHLLIAAFIDYLRMEYGEIEVIYEYVKPGKIIQEQLDNQKLEYKFSSVSTFEILIDPNHLRQIFRGVISYLTKLHPVNTPYNIVETTKDRKIYSIQISADIDGASQTVKDFEMEYELSKALINFYGGKLDIKTKSKSVNLIINLPIKPKRIKRHDKY